MTTLRARAPHDPALASDILARSARMHEAVMRAAEVFHPSLFWRDIGRQNEGFIETYGLENFKRTISQNYFNWAVEGPYDPQMQVLLRAWADAPIPTPLECGLLGDPAVLSINDTEYLTSPSAARGYTLFVGLLWWWLSQRDPGGHNLKLNEPDVGNPIRMEFRGQAISQDLANSLRDFLRMEPHLAAENAVLAEIGAGYGRVGSVALQLRSSLRYWIFDIAPALAVSEWYLETTFPDRKVFRWRPFDRWEDVADEIAAADIALFTVDQLALVPDGSVDCFAAISALHEMRPEQIEAYMALMARTSRAIYTKNWTTWRNPHDAFDFSSEALQAPGGWRTALEVVDPIIPAFTEKLFVAGG
ncbi:putative sugar O-methyltransferase [Caulobacter endophyticus]|uniref:putative sugar O-methyltransferase n=1 Tax=Caulobacter endophyticus TaxID=2172652 RepID=UPI00240FA09C|nr:putative sugar O-methyltransferase [Caulobacter endophyticus]MDG2528797.1 putative sugar O-methyltransferase [Caulobacter endophyticus]